jgi:hypothetical protein
MNRGDLPGDEDRSREGLELGNVSATPAVGKAVTSEKSKSASMFASFMADRFKKMVLSPPDWPSPKNSNGLHALLALTKITSGWDLSLLAQAAARHKHVLTSCSFRKAAVIDFCCSEYCSLQTFVEP